MKTTKEYQALDSKHHLHPFTNYKSLSAAGSRIITAAEDCYVTDAQYGKLLDGMSGLWCCSLGYTQPKIVEAITKQLETLPFYNNFFQCSHGPAIELAAELSAIAPDDFNNVFYTGSGSEGNDTVMRLVQRYWALKEQPEKRIFISRINAYHGSTIAAGSLGGMKFMHEQYNILPNVTHIEQPYWYADGGDMTPDEFGLYTAGKLEEKILELGVENVAAFIAEPIQGSGGVIVPPDTYWPEIKRILNKYDILFISDEVIFGFGRSGKWFGFEHYDLEPDMINFAKSVTNGFQPLGGVIINDKVADVIKTETDEFGHGFTYSGHPASCAAALATLEIIKEQGLIDHVANEIGPYFEKCLNKLESHPLVGEIRTKGMVCAIELVKNKEKRERYPQDKPAGPVCRDACIENGLVMRAVGETMVAAPQITMTKAQVDEFIRKCEEALDSTLEKLSNQ